MEQLIRLELTYGKIFGFIAYSHKTDFYAYLKKIIDETHVKSESNFNQKTNNSIILPNQ